MLRVGGRKSGRGGWQLCDHGKTVPCRLPVKQGYLEGKRHLRVGGVSAEVHQGLSFPLLLAQGPDHQHPPGRLLQFQLHLLLWVSAWPSLTRPY